MRAACSRSPASVGALAPHGTHQEPGVTALSTDHGGVGPGGGRWGGCGRGLEPANGLEPSTC